jgi:hypothetical protein
MKRVRYHLFSVALATLSIQALVIALGVARVCWGAEHTHGGGHAADCPHHAGSSQSVSHAHHAASSEPAHQDHHDVSNVATDAQDRLTCGCSSRVIAAYIGPAGIVPAPAFLPASTQVALLARARRASPTDVWFPPLSPPPRMPFSQHSAHVRSVRLQADLAKSG